MINMTRVMHVERDDEEQVTHDMVPGDPDIRKFNLQGLAARCRVRKSYDGEVIFDCDRCEKRGRCGVEEQMHVRITGVPIEEEEEIEEADVETLLSRVEDILKDAKPV